MAYTIEEISIINQQGQAVEGVNYHTLNGDTYRGTSEGRLIKVENDFLDLEDKVNGIRQSAEYDDTDIRNEIKKASCKNLAMTIVLG